MVINLRLNRTVAGSPPPKKMQIVAKTGDTVSSAMGRFTTEYPVLVLPTNPTYTISGRIYETATVLPTDQGDVTIEIG
jgi:hypothetical protein